MQTWRQLSSLANLRQQVLLQFLCSLATASHLLLETQVSTILLTMESKVVLFQIGQVGFVFLYLRHVELTGTLVL